MDLAWLEDFLAIVDEGGFSRAAERRRVTQPALSRRIRALEDWLGTPLIERGAHTLALTPAGESFCAVADDVVRRVRAGRDQALEAARLKAETVTFAVTHALSQTFVPKWIRKFESGASLQLLAANLAGCERMLAEGQAHFLVAHYHPTLASLADPTRYLRLDLETDALVPVSAPGSGWTLPGSRDAPLPYLAYHPGSGIGRIVTAFLAGKEACWLQPGFAAPVMLLTEMAREGRGVTWAPESLVRGDFSAGRLARAGGDDWDIAITISLLRPRARMTRAAEAFWGEAVKRGR